MQVGWVGLGSLGAPTARMVMRAGWPLTVWGRRPEAVEPFRATDAAIASSPADLGARSDIVGIMVNDDRGVEEVALAVLEGMKPGSVIANHTTGHPDTSRRLAEIASKRGVTFIDAAISGGQRLIALEAQLSGAEDPSIPRPGDFGTLMTVMAGSDDVTFERCKPVFQSFGDPVLLMGPVGAGQAAKLINNSLLAANMVLVDEALRLARSLSLDPEPLVRVLQTGSGASHALNLYVRRVRMGALQGPADELTEHVESALRLFQEAGAQPTVLHLVAERVSALREVGGEVLAKT